MGLLFFSFALKNIFRSKWRTIFTIILLTIGISSMVVCVALNEFSTPLVSKLLNQSEIRDNITNSYSLAMANISNSSNFPNEAGMSQDFNVSDISLIEKSMVDSLKKLLFYLNVFLVIIGSLVIMLGMLKAVGDRTREIGVLKSVGWTNNRVLTLILLESIFQLLISWIVVIILVLILYLREPNLHETIETFNFVRIFGISFLFSLSMPIIGVIIPLLKALHIKPSEALRYE
ncbi:MAG: ABC transporter permease [Methanobrevibacter sp.]|jgi:putative ABC transport system permease protein|nr:ABC transporter permease [Methanobrevibacter sp.]